MGNGDNEKVRVRAYYLWEAEGCPEGRDGEFWERALQEQQASALDRTSEPPKAKRATAKPPSAKQAKTPKASPPSASKKAPKRRSRPGDSEGAPGTASMHMRPAPAEQS